MCGITGIVRNDNRPIEADRARNAAALIKERGPDGSGVWYEGNVAFGHCRLSIIDLSEAAKQPMISVCGRYVITYNGEIYNFAALRQDLHHLFGEWKSQSDTEVILAAYIKWGNKCVDHLNGMFAFAIWDREDKTLFAARDRLGEKPFYYHHSDRCFAFASRPRALFALSDGLLETIDIQALRLFFESGYIPAPYSIYEEIKKLPPAHYLILKNGECRIERYWDFRQINIDYSLEKRPENDLLDELDEIISRSVHARMVSDVPLGAFLSGGIDSSLVVAMMNRYSPHAVKTFTIGFNEKKYDESEYANSVAEYLGTDHHCEHMSVDALTELMPEFTQNYDEPFFDHSAFPVMAVSRMARRSVTVSLSGDGGDELFGGYHYYGIVEKLEPFFRLPYGVRKLLSPAIKLIPGHKLKLLAGALNQPEVISSFAFCRSISKDFNPLIPSSVLDQTCSIAELFKEISSIFPFGLHAADKGMRLDTFYTLPDDYLQKVDVASMAFSLETRIPLLDHNLVEWAMKLPVFWKLKNGDNKYLLRKLAYRYIPQNILDRPKQGFGVPVNDWLRKDLKTWAEERLNDKAIFRNIPLDQSRVLSLWKLHQSGKRNVHPLLWAVLIFLDFYASREKTNRSI